MYATSKYYSKNSSGDIQGWRGVADENGKVLISVGLLTGKQTTIISTVEAKANRTPHQQAVLELKAKERQKHNGGYKTALELGIDTNDERVLLFELDKKLSINKTDINNILKPMKAQTFKEGKIKYPVICQPKINGYRTTAVLLKPMTTDLFNQNAKLEAKLLTKEGHEYIMPHINTDLSKLWYMDTSIVFDGELYKHGDKISELKRRVRMRKSDSNTISNNSLPSEVVKFCVFDLSIAEISQIERLKIKDGMLLQCNEIYYNSNRNTYEFSNASNHKYSSIVNVRATIIYSDAEAFKHRDAAIASGFEGIVLRDLDAEYMFGGRKKNMIKLKSTISSEFEILDVILKNESNIRTYVGLKLRNDINDQTFEVSVFGTEEDRNEYLANPELLIGRRISLSFGERTITGIPFHITDMNIREIWDLSETNIEDYGD